MVENSGMVHTGDGVSYLEEVVENSGMVHNGDGRGSDEWDNGVWRGSTHVLQVNLFFFCFLFLCFSTEYVLVYSRARFRRGMTVRSFPLDRELPSIF